MQVQSAAATIASACASVRQWLAASVAAAWWQVARRWWVILDIIFDFFEKLSDDIKAFVEITDSIVAFVKRTHRVILANNAFDTFLRYLTNWHSVSGRVLSYFLRMSSQEESVSEASVDGA
ncbi:hypothetical protein Tco_1105158 [Tanacetum coccineum]